MVITLIGYRGCGKSSVAPLLADRLNCDYVDSDVVIEQRAGRSVSDIFAQQGEAAFRTLETDVLADLLRRDCIVIAAGGGAILSESNRHKMRAAGPVVWLQASPITLAGRIAADEASGRTRPSLTGRAVVDEVTDVLDARRPLYAAAATLTIDTDELEPADIADRILRAVTEAAAESRPS